MQGLSHTPEVCKGVGRNLVRQRHESRLLAALGPPRVKIERGTVGCGGGGSAYACVHVRVGAQELLMGSNNGGGGGRGCSKSGGGGGEQQAGSRRWLTKAAVGDGRAGRRGRHEGRVCVCPS